MQDEASMNFESAHPFDNYFGTSCGINTLAHNRPGEFRSLSPRFMRTFSETNPQANLQRNLAISSSRRSIHSTPPFLTGFLSAEGSNITDQIETTQSVNNRAINMVPYRTSYRAPLLKANGRSLSARDSQEELILEKKMNGQNSIYTKRLLPVTPDENPRRMGSLSAVRNNQLSLDLNTDIEFDLMQRRLQDRLTFNENLMNKEKQPTPIKRLQSPGGVDSETSHQSLASPKQFAEPQKKLLQGCSRRLNFQRLHHQKMGQDTSRPPSFSNSFDFSTVYCKPNVVLAQTRTNSIASEDGACEMHLSVKTQHASSTGSLQTGNSQVPKQKRSVTRNPITNGGKSTPVKNVNGKAVKKAPQTGISGSSQAIIRFCIENSKGDIITRVINRMINNREDFTQFINNLSPKHYQEFTNSLREFFNSVVQHLQSTEKITTISKNYGIEQVERRTWGFKADYFTVMANAITTECVFLDGAQHQPTEAIEAWSELIELCFSNIRDAYYDRVRYLRKGTHCFKSTYSQSSDVSNEETPVTTPKPADTQFD